VIKVVPSITIRSALFDNENSKYSMDFDIDKQNTGNILLSFSAKEYSGPLSITLNGREIYSGTIESTNPAPIILDPGYLTDKNTLVFSVPSPGWAFWKSNSYTLENLQITGDVTDKKNAFATQIFTLSEAEKANLDSITLFFNPVCTLSNVGQLIIDLNSVQVFDSVADCGTKSFVVLDKNSVLEGSNELKFSTDSGQYLLDNIYVKLTLTKPAFNTYFFDLKDTYFKTTAEEARCGDIDGVCPVGCSEEQDGDCCFKHDEFWCALPTNNFNDRCVSYVDASNCGLCPTGYYDSSGDAPANCQDRCGDNKDNTCLSSCPSPSKYYDKDCCYASDPANFWCKEAPITGISDKCRASVDSSQCSLCPSGYVDKGGSRPDSCSSSDFQFTETTKDLLDNYQVRLIVRFIDDTSRKRVDFNINGYRISIDTYAIEYTQNIDAYVRSGTNTIEIVPVQDIDIAEINAEIRQVS
jgi:hypothetical protein